MPLKANRQFVQFIMGGGVAAGANITARYWLNQYLDYELSIVLAYGVGMLTAFLIFKFLVFKARHTHRTLKESLWFIVINLLALAQTFIVSVGLADYIFPWVHFTFYPYSVAHVIGVGIPVITSYVGHKHLTFGEKTYAAHKLG